MPRSSTGGVVYDERRQPPRFAIRFRAYGRRTFVTLGTTEEGWTREKAEDELQRVLAAVRDGTWRPRIKAAPVIDKDPAFGEFAKRWFDENKHQWRFSTCVDYEWQLSSHLLPFFAGHRLSQITIAEVDRYRNAKLVEGTLSATSINKTIQRLAQILELAADHDLVTWPNGRNPAVGKRRRVKVVKPRPVWLDNADHMAALLDAAASLDALARRDRQHIGRRAILATLMFSGLRIGELCNLRWRDIDLEAGVMTITGPILLREGVVKTFDGHRRIDLLPVLREELLALKASRGDLRFRRTRRTDPESLVFPTLMGEPLHPSNIRNRVLTPAVKRANERLAAAGKIPLPDGISPHKLRHTFASLLFALGVDPVSVMDQLGHADPEFTLRRYGHAMRRDQAARDALRRLVGLDGPEAAAA